MGRSKAWDWQPERSSERDELSSYEYSFLGLVLLKGEEGINTRMFEGICWEDGREKEYKNSSRMKLEKKFI